MKKLLSFALLSLVLVLSTGWHKFYLSVTQVDYAPQEHEVQIITRLFYDDLQVALQERYDKSIRVEKTYDQQKLNGFIEKYIDQKLKISIDGSPAELHYLGHEDENDYVVCYISIKNIDTVNKLSIQNTLLMDVFPEQKNVVHTHVGNFKKSTMLTYDNDKAVLNISE